MQILQADTGDALDRDLEAAVFAFARDGNFQLDLCVGGWVGEKLSGKSRKVPCVYTHTHTPI